MELPLHKTIDIEESILSSFRLKLFFVAIALTVIVLCCLSASFAAEERITLSQALEQFYANNYDILIHRYETDKSYADFVGARLFPNPTFSFESTGHETNFQTSDHTQQIFRMDQLIELGGKRGLRTGAAQETLEAVKLGHKDTIRTLLIGFFTLFYNLKLDTLNVELAVEELKRYDRILHIASKRFDAGHLSLVDYTKIRIGRIDLESNLTNLETQLKNNGEQFILLIGGKGPLRPDVQIRGVFPEYLEEELIGAAYKNRYDFLSLQKQQKAAEYNTALAKAGRIPDVTVGAEYERFGREGTPGIGIGLSFNIPVFNRNQGDILRKKAEYRQIELQIEKLKRQIAVDIHQALNNFAASIKILESYQGKKTDIEELLNRSEDAFALGGITALDLLDTKKICRDFRSKYNQVLVQSNLNEELIKISTGELK